MEVSIEQLEKFRLVILRLHGIVDRGAVLAFAELFHESCAAHAGYSRLLDLRGVSEIDLEFSTLMEVARKKEAAADSGGSEDAYCIWVEGDASYGFARMYQNLLESTGAPLQIAIAENAAAAAEFLGVDPQVIISSAGAADPAGTTERRSCQDRDGPEEPPGSTKTLSFR